MHTEESAADIPDHATLLAIFSKMALIRLCDERLRSIIRAGQLAIPYYSPRGQEVIPSALAVTLTDSDYLVTTYRGLHDILAKGVPLRSLLAEYAGRASGLCKGKGGPMHVTNPASGVMVTTGIVGSSMPIANGLALASQVRGDGRVTVAMFGDGASNIGAFHESLNLAAVWKLPVVFVCQNNEYAEHTAFETGTAARRVSDRAASYTIPGITVDGNDPLLMWRAAKDAVERARNGLGPTLLEAKTFRFYGHNLGDDDSYIPKERKAAAMAQDPSIRYRAWLIAHNYADETALNAIETRTGAEIEDAMQFALSAPYPDIGELALDVLSEEHPP